MQIEEGCKKTKELNHDRKEANRIIAPVHPTRLFMWWLFCFTDLTNSSYLGGVIRVSKNAFETVKGSYFISYRKHDTSKLQSISDRTLYLFYSTDSAEEQLQIATRISYEQEQSMHHLTWV